MRNRKKITLLGWILLVCTVCYCFVSCKTAPRVEDGQTIPFSLCDGYFVRNDAPRIPRGKITSQAAFDRFFGGAATMSNLPTEIDFKKQFVIAVSQTVTDTATTYEPMSLVREGRNLKFTYRVDKGEKLSYSVQPLMLIVVDRQYEAAVELLEK